MRLALRADRTRESQDEVDDGTSLALAELDRGMRWPAAGMDSGGQAPKREHALLITLRDGFRGHAVVITVEGREVYRRTDVTTARSGSRADMVELVTGSRVAHVAISATPGNYVASLDVDVSAHPHLAISLVGESTVSFEPSPPRVT